MAARIRSIDPYRLSDSTMRDFNRCEKFFQLYRMCDTDMPRNNGSPATIRGSAFGIGVQTYFLTGDIEQALYQTWLAYWPIDENRPYISCSRTLNNLLVAKEKLDILRRRYEVAIFEGKPAIELSFRLNKIGSKYYYVGYIDLVLFDKEEGIYVVFEIKTTGYNLTDLEPVYKNQGQTLAYSIVLDKIASSNLSKYGVLYFVVRDKGKNPIPDIYSFAFTKTLTDRLKWFVSYGLDLEKAERMEELGIYPMRGESCVSFNRVCTFYNNCQLESLAENKRAKPETEEEYQFTYDLDDLVEDHIQRVQTQSGLSGLEEML